MIIKLSVIALTLMAVILPVARSQPLDAQQGQLTVTPNRGPVGTQVTLEGTGCNNPGQSTSLFFGSQGETSLTGTVGTAGSGDISQIPTDSQGHFRTTFTIPAQLETYQGRGGGPVAPGTYNFYSSPPLCITGFTVTPASASTPATPGSTQLPNTGGSPGGDLSRLGLPQGSIPAVAVGMGLLLLGAALVGTSLLRPRCQPQP